MAALSFTIILMQWQEKLNTQFEWREKVLQKAKIHPQWLADIKDSVVLDALVPRVGSVMHYATSEFLIFLPDIIRIFPDIPIYINWGPKLPVHVPDYLCPLKPDDELTYMSDDSDKGNKDFYVPLYDDDDDNHNKGIYSSSADLMCVHGITNDMPTPESQTEASTDEIRDALDDLVYYRFGFVAPSFPVASPSSTPEMHHVCKYMGVLQDASITQGQQENLCHFFGYLQLAHIIEDVPATFYDL
ncbi:hypothetical protein F5146DRAFT_1146694 [Armillaria mellea]|nr:hypothetical protein F5146DRAFT_1146694 [Armillaria mellea]